MTLNWGAFPPHRNQSFITMPWRQSDPFTQQAAQSYLPHGNGRSYGDSCLNTQGVLIDMLSLNHFLEFDTQTGILRCESGVLLADILHSAVPQGWVLPVLPGTQFVTVGGAIANDVHGKNHSYAGTFGCHILQFELLRSDGSRWICSLDSNLELFEATIGGLGLTGIILWAEIQLQPLSSPYFEVETRPFQGLQAFYALMQQVEDTAGYSVAWLDCLAKGRQFARGLLMTANPCVMDRAPPEVPRTKRLPCHLPASAVNRYSMSVFNTLYYHRHARKQHQVMPYQQYFFPLDSILEWNKVYGKHGFLQYQCVLPWGSEHYLEAMLADITASGLGSCLSVLKTFGTRRSPGLLSFPMPGVTLALDFPNRPCVFTLLDRLDATVIRAGGRVYCAKDARMSATAFQCYYPQLTTFSRWVDPKLSSSFWQRVTSGVF